MQRLIIAFALCAVLMSSVSHSGEMRGVSNPAKTRVMYMMHCQGCHLSDGSGVVNRVPNMHNYLANFLQVKGGREFLVQVPGSANAPLNDGELAQLLNWMLTSFSPKLLGNNWQTYTAKEISAYRSRVLTEVIEHRQALVRKIDKL
jgi:hypothetical protein